MKIRIWPGNKTFDLATGKLLGSIPAVKGDDIYFAGYEPSGPKSVPNIYKYNLSLGSTEQITKSAAENWRPAVGSDGAIYFIGSTLENGFDIYRIDDYSKSPELAFSSKEDEWDPAVSPDGQLIAFASKLGGNWNIYLGKSDSLQKANRITDLPGNSWDPSFDPSGRMIVFASTRNHQPYIYGLCVFGENSDSDR